MRRLLFSIFAICALLVGGAAFAQNPNNMVGGSQFNPPLPPPPPSPSTAVPVVPRMDVQSPHYGNGSYGYNDGSGVDGGSPRGHRSFPNRVSRCLAEADAGGFRPGNRRDYYVRSCINR
jgi:hypothetical protein